MLTEFKTPPYKHQIEALSRGYDAPYFAYFMEQGTGKTKVTIDEVCSLHREQPSKLDTLIVVTPNGVNRNWIDYELPAHLWDGVKATTACWVSTPRKADRKALEELEAAKTGLRVLTVNIEAFISKKTIAFVKAILDKSVDGAMIVVDESTRIQNDQAVTVKNLLDVAKHKRVRYRRILNGTPVTEGPLNLYGQLLFLSPKALPVQSKVVFRNRYAEYLPANHPLVIAAMRRSNSRFAPPIIATDAEGKPKYRNLEELKNWVDRFSYRVLKSECIELPPKIYRRWSVHLTPQHARTVKEYLDRLRTGDTPAPVSKLVAGMLYQRLLNGVIPKQLSGAPDHERMFTDWKDNARLVAMKNILDDTGPTIIFARFRTDIQDIAQMIEDHYGEQPSLYYGEVNGAERKESIAAFKEGRSRFFVCNAASAGVGLTLTQADNVVYYSNTFRLYERLQSEDRAHRIGQTKNVVYTDLETPGSIDTRIIESLRDKKDVADLITGDPAESWLAFQEGLFA
jgi:SNF2 family DNA or RNA helicase